MHKSIKFFGVLAVAGLIAAGGSAYTASNTQAESQVVGYGSTTISGATAKSMVYGLNDTGTSVTSVTVVLAGDTLAVIDGRPHASAMSIGFNDEATTSCAAGILTPAVQHQAAGTDPVTPEVLAAPAFTTYTCSGLTQGTEDLDSTEIVVN